MKVELKPTITTQKTSFFKIIQFSQMNLEM